MKKLTTLRSLLLLLACSFPSLSTQDTFFERLNWLLCGSQLHTLKYKHTQIFTATETVKFIPGSYQTVCVSSQIPLFNSPESFIEFYWHKNPSSKMWYYTLVHQPVIEKWNCNISGTKEIKSIATTVHYRGDSASNNILLTKALLQTLVCIKTISYLYFTLGQ